MKTKDYNLIETTLENVIVKLNIMNESTDTSYNKDSSYENEKDVYDWNIKLEETMNNLQILKDWLIFTFEMKD